MLIILILTCSRLIFAQAPQGLNYQAVAYDAGGLPVANQNISVRLSILDGSATGTLVYLETQDPQQVLTVCFLSYLYCYKLHYPKFLVPCPIFTA